MTTTYTITIGLESPTLSEQEARTLALLTAARCFPNGHTITEATGRWLSDRDVIDEASLVITVIGEGMRAHVAEFCTAYKVGARQDAVLLQITKPETIWV